MQSERQHQHEQRRKNREFSGPHGKRLTRRGTLFLGEELGFRALMRDRTLSLVQRKLVLQPPSKNRHGKHQQAERQQNCLSVIT